SAAIASSAASGPGTTWRRRRPALPNSGSSPARRSGGFARRTPPAADSAPSAGRACSGRATGATMSRSRPAPSMARPGSPRPATYSAISPATPTPCRTASITFPAAAGRGRPGSGPGRAPRRNLTAADAAFPAASAAVPLVAGAWRPPAGRSEVGRRAAFALAAFAERGEFLVDRRVERRLLVVGERRLVEPVRLLPRLRPARFRPRLVVAPVGDDRDRKSVV